MVQSRNKKEKEQQRDQSSSNRSILVVVCSKIFFYLSKGSADLVGNNWYQSSSTTYARFLLYGSCRVTSNLHSFNFQVTVGIVLLDTLTRTERQNSAAVATYGSRLLGQQVPRIARPRPFNWMAWWTVKIQHTLGEKLGEGSWGVMPMRQTKSSSPSLLFSYQMVTKLSLHIAPSSSRQLWPPVQMTWTSNPPPTM